MAWTTWKFSPRGQLKEQVMLNTTDSNMAVNAISHAAAMAQESIQQAAQCYMAAHVIYKPKLYRDGNQWCALLGDDLQSGVCGFGSSPHAAMMAFDAAWYEPIPDNATQGEPRPQGTRGQI